MIILCMFFASANAQDSLRNTQAIADTSSDSTKLVKPDLVLDSTDFLKTDSIPSKAKMQKRHSAKRAAWMSAVLPGLGQVYNKRWWKVPIIYAGFAGLSYGIYHFSTNYTGYRKAYRIQVDGDSSTFASFKGISDPDELKIYRDSNKQNLDIMAIITAVWYALNIVDAVVDAHLFHWNMDDNLALDLHPVVPSYFNNTAAIGISFQFSLRQPTTKKLFQL